MLSLDTIGLIRFQSAEQCRPIRPPRSFAPLDLECRPGCVRMKQSFHQCLGHVTASYALTKRQRRCILAQLNLALMSRPVKEECHSNNGIVETAGSNRVLRASAPLVTYCPSRHSRPRRTLIAASHQLTSCKRSAHRNLENERRQSC